MTLAVCRPKNKKDFCLRDRFSMITLKEKPGELFIAQRKLSEAEMERDRMIWDRRNADWAAMYEIKSQLESQKKKVFLCKLTWKASECSKN